MIIGSTDYEATDHVGLHDLSDHENEEEDAIIASDTESIGAPVATPAQPAPSAPVSHGHLNHYKTC